MHVYFDHNASTPLDPLVLEAMMPYMQMQYGNPSSQHRLGRSVRTALESARQQVAALVNAQPNQVVFTSGGTEANNLAIKGVVAANPGLPVYVGATEHPSVLCTAESLKSSGTPVELLTVNENGLLQDEALSSITAKALVSIMLANNETGVIQDFAGLAGRLRETGSLLHTDAVQAVGKINVDFQELGTHLMSLSGHKINGPKGIGALIVDNSVQLRPLLDGGGHERGLRAGTENVAGIVGFGLAAELARTRQAEWTVGMKALRDRLERGLKPIKGLQILAETAPRLCNTVCFSISGIQGETLLMEMDRAGYAISSGSACSSSKKTPSHVLSAMGFEQEQVSGVVRVSLGHGNTKAHVDEFLDKLSDLLTRLSNAGTRAVST